MSENSVIEIPTRIRYTFEMEVLNVEERFDIKRTNWRRDPSDPTGTKNVCDEERVSLGWYARLSDSSAVYFGMEKPDFGKGDTLEMSAMRKIK